MATWIALLRGIGGGIRPLPMKDLKTALESIGLENVTTYIQTGNVVFKSAKATAAGLRQRISDCVSTQFGFDAKVMVLSVKGLEKAAAGNPFPKAEAEPKTLHLFFMDKAPSAADTSGMNKLKAASEAFTLKGNVLYLYTPKGFGISKLAERVERLLGVPATARNWRTVTTVLKMAQEAH